MKVARRMTWYPVAYTILVIPIVSTRIATFIGAPVPYQVTIFTASIFMLSGFVNAVLFTTTRRVLPANNIFPEFIRKLFGISTSSPTGILHTHDSSNPAMSMRKSERVYTEVIDIGVSVEIGMVADYGCEVVLLKEVHTTSERPSRSFERPSHFSDSVLPFSHPPLGSSTRNVAWDDWETMSPLEGPRQRHGSGTRLSSPDTPVINPGEMTSLNVNAFQYPITPYQPNPSPRPISDNIDACLNPRDRGDHNRSGVYAYGSSEFTSPHIDNRGYIHPAAKSGPS